VTVNTATYNEYYAEAAAVGGTTSEDVQFATELDVEEFEGVYSNDMATDTQVGDQEGDHEEPEFTALVLGTGHETTESYDIDEVVSSDNPSASYVTAFLRTNTE
jgi:hypothetical protein